MSLKLASHKSRKINIGRLSAGIALIWLGMILGISFLEAPIKFMAPSVTLEIGLDIGRYVFGAFNKVECAFALLMALLLITIRKKDRTIIPLVLAWLSLALQTVWLLPVLDARVEVIIQGRTPAPSILHTIYVALEVLKALAIAVYGFWNILSTKPVPDAPK